MYLSHSFLPYAQVPKTDLHPGKLIYRKITYDRKATLCISGVSLNLKKRRKARHYLFTSNPMRNAASANEA